MEDPYCDDQEAFENTGVRSGLETNWEIITEAMNLPRKGNNI